MDVTIRPAELHERDALEALQWRASLAWERYREALLANPDSVELPLQQIAEGCVLVAEAEGRVLGFAAWFADEEAQASLDSLFVEPGHWHAGIGRRLIEAVIEAATAAGMRNLVVVANPLALGFYTACRFEEVATTQTRFGPAPRMARTLP